MCIIIHALSKRHVRRSEIENSMDANPAGFFMETIRKRKNARPETRFVRTLDRDTLLRFFDAAEDDDEIVFHARIPSRGETNIENVHGWTEDGITFAHNMTITSIDDMMKRANWNGTDSEFFFRKLFIPFFRGCGKSAYADGKFCDEVHNFVQHFAGYSNKFIFIMPDGTVFRYGEWRSEPDRLTEDGRVAFYASNATYMKFTPAWGASTCRPGIRGCLTYLNPIEGEPRSTRIENPEEPEDGEDPVDALGKTNVVRLALSSVVARNLERLRANDTETGRFVMSDALPFFCSDEVERIVTRWFNTVDVLGLGDSDFDEFVAQVADAFAAEDDGTFDEDVDVWAQGFLEAADEELDAFLNLTNANVRPFTTDVDEFAEAFRPVRVNGGLAMVKIPPSELLDVSGLVWKQEIYPIVKFLLEKARAIREEEMESILKGDTNEHTVRGGGIPSHGGERRPQS